MPFSRNALFCECLHRSLDNSKSYLSIALKFCVQFYKCLSYILLFFWSLLWIFFLNLTFFIKLSNFGKAKKKKRFMFPVTCPKWKFRVDRHQPFFFYLFFSPRSQKPHQIKKMLTFRTFLFRNCLQNSYIFIFVLESPHQMKKFLTFRTILFQNCLQIS